MELQDVHYNKNEYVETVSSNLTFSKFAYLKMFNLKTLIGVIYNVVGMWTRRIKRISLFKM